MASSDMPFWISFFKEAGIPAGDAANYAVTFTDNRITRSMLLDLTKEYLNDMGISILGDVIAILKHGKSVFNQDVRDRKLRDTSAMQETPPLKKSTPASRTIDHYLRAAERSSSPLLGNTGPKLSKEMSARLGSPATTVASVPDVQQSPSILRLRAPSKPAIPVEPVPIDKARRVFPEDEGHYTINLPKGSTSRTKKLLAQQRQQAELQRIRAEEEKKRLAGNKSSVFARLGSEKPKSTTGVEGSSPEPTVTITGLGSISMPAGSAASQSIFSRLGGKTAVKRAATSTVTFDDDDDLGSEPLEYAGVFKNPQSPEKKPKLAAAAAMKIKKTAHKTLAAKTKVMEPETAGVLASRSGTSVDVRSRLGLKTAAHEVTSTTPGQGISSTQIARKKVTTTSAVSKSSQLDTITITVARSKTSAVKSSPKPAAQKATTKAVKKPPVSPTTSGVFSRLGKPKP